MLPISLQGDNEYTMVVNDTKDSVHEVTYGHQCFSEEGTSQWDPPTRYHGWQMDYHILPISTHNNITKSTSNSQAKLQNICT